MSFRGLLRPGQGFKAFKVLKREGVVSESGRPRTGGLVPHGGLIGIISQANQREVEQSKQNGHPITHTIVQRGRNNRAKPTDVLELEHEGRRFIVKTVDDPGELGHFTIYRVEERADLQ